MEEEITLDLREFLGIIVKRIKMIVAITLAATLISGIVSFLVIKPTYEATLSVFIGKTSETNNETVAYNSSDITMYQKLVKTYAQIATSNDVAEKAAAQLGNNLNAKQILGMLKVTPQQDTQIMDIKVQSKNPDEARQIVEKVTALFIEKSEKIIPNGNVQILDKAKTPENPIKPNKKLNLAIAFFLGLMISVGLSFVLEYMDNTIKSQEDIEKYLEIPVLGIIPEHEADE